MEPSFIRAHSQQSISTSSSRNQPFFLVNGNLNDERYAAVASPRAPHHELFSFRNPPFGPSPSSDDYYFKLVGCSGGLVCLSQYSDLMYPTSIYIWNPSLGVGGGEFRELHPGNYCEDFLTFGFGYDSVNDDYKVVNLKRRGDSKSEIYGLRNGAWKDISQPFPLHCGDIVMPDETDVAVTINGFIHWLCLCWYYDNNNRIEKEKPELVRFKLAGEVFDSFSIPEEPELCKDYGISTLDGKLCAFYSAYSHLDIWVMTEYGVVGSWVKMYVLQQNPFSWQYVFKGITLRGDIILLDKNRGVTLYDPYNTAEKTTSYYLYLCPTTPFVANYVESLISVAIPPCHSSDQFKRSKDKKEDEATSAAPGGFLANLARRVFWSFSR